MTPNEMMFWGTMVMMCVYVILMNQLTPKT